LYWERGFSKLAATQRGKERLMLGEQCHVLKNHQPRRQLRTLSVLIFPVTLQQNFARDANGYPAVTDGRMMGTQ
jgi:hypothetical protein